nr:recombinase family protein [Rhodococcus wratislaviensis]GLK38673.1 serine recombinase [Rhodococcus wratislaviensis]
MTTTIAKNVSACTEVIYAVIYCRVSRDPNGRQSSTEQQEEECREECARRGWVVREVIVDNSISASRYSTKDRPGYKELIKTIRPGEVLVVWETSRTGRKMEDHLALRHLCEDNSILFCAGGDVVDFSKSGDRFSAGIKAQVDEYSSDQTRDRILRDVRARAAEGRPHGNLGFGYVREFDNATGKTRWLTDPEKAPIVKEMAERLLGGETLYSVAADLNARGIAAPGRGPKETGRPWRPEQVKALILRPAYAGLRQFQGSVIREGNWDAILTESEHRRLAAILTNPSRLTTHVGPKPRYLLSGIAVCAVCERPVRYAQPKGRNPQYRCPKGHVGRNATDVEAVVLPKLFSVIDGWRANEWLMAEDDEEENTTAAEYRAEAKELQKRIDAATEEYKSGHLSARLLGDIEAGLQPQIDALDAKAKEARTGPALSALLATAEAWDDADITVRRQVLRAFLEIRIDRTSADHPLTVIPRKIRR